MSGQVLIVDSSTDRTPEIALAHGAEVLRTPRRGLGRAYIDAISCIRGKWIIMGDADLTYDFRELGLFVERFREGSEFVMGSRFKGSIEAGAMPALHRYFGTPLTTWILNRIYRSKFSDIHCGMRGITWDALLKIDLRSQSWEYASEMVLKAARLGLRISEVPVRFLKDRPGRFSHHRRTGWTSPWTAGWINLKVMLVYSPDTFLVTPGTVLLVFGLLLTLRLGFGSFVLGGIGFDLHWMLAGLTCTTLGLGCIQIGIIARAMHGLRSGIADPVRRLLTYNWGMILSIACTVGGFVLLARFVVSYVVGGFRLAQASHPAILGLMLIIFGFQCFGFTLLLEMARRTSGSENGA